MAKNDFSLVLISYYGFATVHTPLRAVVADEACYDRIRILSNAGRFPKKGCFNRAAKYWICIIFVHP
jgi:hypothetical protein